MKEILEIMIKNLVEDKDSIQITEESDEKTVTLKVKVAEYDMGRIIGKQGRVAKAIRTVMKSVGGRSHKKVNVEFVE